MPKITKALQATAYHEAGHAVAAFIQKRTFHHVSIEPDGDSFGRVVLGRLSSLRHVAVSVDARVERDLERMVIICFAGHVAERNLLGRNNWVASSKDVRQALSCLEYLHGDYEVVSAHAKYLWASTRAIITS